MKHIYDTSLINSTGNMLDTFHKCSVPFFYCYMLDDRYLSLHINLS